MLKKIIFIILLFVLNINILAAEDKKIEEIKETTYRAFILGDKKGNIFYSENEKEMYPLASVTKVMTLMLTYDAINDGRIKFTDKIKVDKVMAEMGGSRIWMKEGSEISVEDLIKATAIYSANNAAYGLAKAVGGNIDTFVEMMNRKAEELGFGEEINYNTPTGLPPHMTGRGQDVGSALGVYKLSLSALKYPDYIKVAGTKEAGLNYLGKAKIYNRNKLLGKDGIYGIKTGHLDNWYNITVASDLKNMDSIVVVLGAETEKERDEKILEGIKLFHENYKIVEFLNKNIPVGNVSVTNGTSKIVELYPNKNYKNIVKNDSNAKFIIYRKENIKAPLYKNDEVGKYELYIDEKLVNEGKLIVKENIEEIEKIF